MATRITSYPYGDKIMKSKTIVLIIETRTRNLMKKIKKLLKENETVIKSNNYSSFFLWQIEQRTLIFSWPVSGSRSVIQQNWYILNGSLVWLHRCCPWPFFPQTWLLFLSSPIPPGLIQCHRENSSLFCPGAWRLLNALASIISDINITRTNFASLRSPSGSRRQRSFHDQGNSKDCSLDRSHGPCRWWPSYSISQDRDRTSRTSSRESRRRLRSCWKLTSSARPKRFADCFVWTTWKDWDWDPWRRVGRLWDRRIVRPKYISESTLPFLETCM